MGERAALALPYFGPWCCEDGQRLAVPVCPACADTSLAYQAAMRSDPPSQQSGFMTQIAACKREVANWPALMKQTRLAPRWMTDNDG